MSPSRMTTILSSATRVGLIYSTHTHRLFKPSANGWDLGCCQLAKGMGGSASKPTVPRSRLHTNARCEIYPGSKDVRRFKVPDDKVAWRTRFPDYKPVDYTSPGVLAGPVWADVDVRTENTPIPKWNSLDGKVDRRSHTGRYEVVDKCPRNPMGRTGVTGRGRLGRWGPNHAADPIVTRWKRDSQGKIQEKSGRRVAQFVAVQRRDTKDWAIPGGMVDPGETVTATLKREFGEEALNSLQVPVANKANIDALFTRGTEIYRGYVDDPRNTDNAWMETVVMNYHDEDGHSVGCIQLNAGDDAVGVQWLDIDSSLKLFASHTDFLHTTATKLNASW
ncbi:ADP-ribose pyrophosphatase, mitochondrial-like [Babylonia areolata]|uniref:ADP-ribose pyrophosphatase, mitochondrial-like n=1 Tax=Babylonia areolata TaxID=304850 RepID=UPI003FD0DE38